MKKVNGMTVYEPEDPCALDEYSEQLEKDLTAKFNEIEDENEQESTNILTLQNKVTNLEKETEEQQGQITELQNKVNVLEDQIPTGQASGNPIYINDSTNLEAKLRLNGGSKQETREGNNLLNFNVEQNSKVTVNADGTLTINGTGGFSLNVEEITLKTGITYYQKWQLVSGNITGVTDPFLSILGSGGYITQNAFLQATTTEDTNKNTIWVHTSAVFENAVVKIWANTDQSDFEQYGVMPSPDYPSKVETVGSNINEFDKSARPIYVAGSTATEIENGIRIATISSNQGLFCLYKIKDITNFKGKTFTVKANWIPSADNKGRMILGLCDTNGQNRIMGPINNTPNTAISYTIPDTLNTSTYLALWLYSNISGTAQAGDYVDYTDIKVELGDKATAYSPYNMGSVEIDVSNKQLFNIRDLVKGMGALNLDEEDFVTVTVDNSGGTSTKYYNVYTNPSKLIKPNTKYYLIMEIKKVSGTGNIFNHSTNETDHKPQFSGSKGYNFTNLIVGDIKIDEITSLEDLTNSNSMLRTFLSYNAGQSGSITFRLSVLEDEPDLETFEYTKYKQQAKIMPIQQEMLEGDYIEDVEHHIWKKIILNGTENITQNSNKNLFVYMLPNDLGKFVGADTIPEILSNQYSAMKFDDGYSGEKDYGITFGLNYGDRICIRNKDYNTVEEFKTALATNNLIIYYKLATPIDLKLTEEQKEAKKINTYKNVTNIVADNSLATLDVTYKKDQNTVNQNYENRIAALEAAILS